MADYPAVSGACRFSQRLRSKPQQRCFSLEPGWAVRSESRQGFGQDGKTTYTSVPYRYMLQALILGADGHAFAFMYESENIYDPESDKEDCGLKAFIRLS